MAAEVIVTLPVEGRFHYRVPAPLAGGLAVGHRVLVPFGRRKVTGFITALDAEPPPNLELKEILERIDREPLLTPDLLALMVFAAEYYLAPAGEVLKVALPPGITAASVARWVLTPEGRAALADPAGVVSPRDRLLLGEIGGGKRRAAVGARAQRLAERGWIAAQDEADPREVEPKIEVAQLIDPARDRKELSRSKVQQQIAEALAAGPRPLAELNAGWLAAAFRRALKALQRGGWIEIREEIRPAAAPISEDLGSSVVPTPEQAAALEVIPGAVDQRTRAAFLLRGVTGSGKTEVYLRAIAHARAQGRGAVVLVPEIALTAQLEARFRARFGDQVVVLHSAISEAERRRRWHRLRSGEARIALGARSAIWSPVADLGVIVVDEEHEPSFKQHNELRYNGRDLALFRAHRAQAVAILGSATPSLETRHLAEQGRITELRLAARVAGRAMPAVQVVDLQERRQGRDAKGEIPLITRPLGDALREVVARNEQAIIFLNRRGFNTIVVCDECQSPRRCPDCDVSLTHHKQEEALICHYCGHREPMRAPCPSCGARQMKPFGAGTERIAEAVREAAPDATVARLDRDVTSKAGAMQEVLDRFRSGLADVLVGTQMVTKGHDFPRVTLVGIICADTSLAFPDFRAAERTFQLLTQVAGRAGRAELPGRVVIQTFQPKHYALTCALAHDDQRFFQLEMTSRRSAGYPPVARMALVRLESGDAERLGEACRALRGIAGPIGEARGVRVRGPAPAPIARIKNRHRAQLMLLAPTPATLIATLRGIKEQLGDPRGVEVGYDVDPLDML